MTQDHKPHMTLPNGDRIYEGGYGRTRDGRKVGPMTLGRDAQHTSYMWAEDAAHEGAWCEAGGYGLTKSFGSDDSDIIAEWTDEPPIVLRKPAPNCASSEEMVAAIQRPAPDYNDGKWHGWNGGECPVHPETVVEVMFAGGGGWTDKADYVQFNWTKFYGAFRVVKPYTAPREWWIVGGCEAYASEAEALEACKALYGNPAPVHVREVTE